MEKRRNSRLHHNNPGTLTNPGSDNMKKRIAIDMDDVLADTHAKFVRLYLNGEAPKHTLDELKEKTFNELLEASDHKALFKQVYEPGFFRDIPVMEGAQDVLVRLQEKYDVFVASAAMEFPNSLREKYDWLAENFPTVHWKNIILMGDKSVLNTDYLIDDMPYNLATFRGEGILFHGLHNRHETAYRRVKSWQDVADYLL